MKSSARQAPVSVTYKGENIYAFSGKSILCGEREIQDTLGKLCEDSVHTYGDTIKEGYVTLDVGYRIVVCGSAHSEGENIRGIYAISSLVIRIPHIVKNAAEGIIDIVKKEQQVVPTLFYAPPGTGKTTLLRDLALKISSGLNAMRVCIVDTRGELYQKELFRNSLVDVLSDYKRGKGMEIATRTMSAQVIICD